MTVRVELDMGSRQTSGFSFFLLLLSFQPIYTMAIFTWAFVLLKMELV